MIKQLSSKIVYQNPWMTVVEDQVEFANGHRGMYGVVQKTDFALIVPFDGVKLHFVKQYRYPTQEFSVEFPQGRHEDEEQSDPLQLAKAELEEEIGLRAGKMQQIGHLHEAPGYSNQGFFIFLATNLSNGETSFDATEVGLDHLSVTPAEFEELILAGTITDAPTLSAYTLFNLHQRHSSPTVNNK